MSNHLIRRRWWIFAMIAALPLHATAKPPDPVAAELLISSRAFAPADTVTVGLSLAVTDRWHVYWDGRNDTGMPPRVAWSLPSGITVGELRWPAPERHVAAGDILDHVLEGEILAVANLIVAADVVAGDSLTVGCRIDWLACRDICVPGRDTTQVRLPVIPHGPAPTDPELVGRLDRARGKLPRPLPPGSPVRWWWDGSILRIRVPGAAELAFYPRSASLAPRDLLREGAVVGDELALRFEDRSDTSDDNHVRGVLAVTDKGGRDPQHWILDIAGPDPSGTVEKEKSR